MRQPVLKGSVARREQAMAAEIASAVNAVDAVCSRAAHVHAVCAHAHDQAQCAALALELLASLSVLLRMGIRCAP